MEHVWLIDPTTKRRISATPEDAVEMIEHGGYTYAEGQTPVTGETAAMAPKEDSVSTDEPRDAVRADFDR